MSALTFPSFGYGYSTARVRETHDHNGRFIVAAMENPAGFKPGLYYYVMHMATGRKVSRYLRRIASADRKAERYAVMYANGDRYWPEVTRCDELRDSPDARLRGWEWFALAFPGMGALHPCDY